MKYIFNIIDFHNGHEDAFKYLYEWKFPRAIQLARIFKLPIEDAEEIFADVMLSIYKKRLSYTSLDQIGAVIYTAVKFNIYNRINKIISAKNYSRHLAFRLNDWSLFVSDVENKELLEKIIPLLNDIPQKWIEILYLSYYKDMSLREIAKTMRKSYHNVSKIRQLCLAYIKDKLIGLDVNLDDIVPDRNKKTGNKNSVITIDVYRKVKDRLAMGINGGDIAREFNLSKKHVSMIRLSKIAYLERQYQKIIS